MGYDLRTSLALQGNTRIKPHFFKTTYKSRYVDACLVFVHIERRKTQNQLRLRKIERFFVSEKTVNVRMSEAEHAILKAYCTFVGRTMSDVLHDFTRQELHTQSICCDPMQSILNMHEMPRDPRAIKPCWGFRCNLCAHEKSCRVGLESKLFIVDPKWVSNIKESHRYIKDFDGTSIDCCTIDQCFTKDN